MFFLSSTVVVYSKLTFSQKMFKEYHQCQRVWMKIRPDLILIQTICIGSQQMTKVVTSGQC